MLSIKTNNDFLIIPDNIRISCNGVNPMLVDNKKNNSLNFGLPSINKKYIGANHLPGVKRIPETPVDIQFKSFLKRSTLKYSSLNKDAYGCSCDFDETIFLEAVEEYKMSDISNSTNTLANWLKLSFEHAGYRIISNIANSNTYLKTLSLDPAIAGRKTKYYKCIHTDITKLTISIYPEFYFDFVDEFTSVGWSQILNRENFNNYPNWINHVVDRLNSSPLSNYLISKSSYFINDNGTMSYGIEFTSIEYTNLDISISATYPDGEDSSTDDTAEDKHIEGAELTYTDMQEMSVKDFLQSIRNLFNLQFVINENQKSVEIISLEHKLRSLKVIDITKYCTDDMSKKNNSTVDRFVFKVSLDNDDNTASISLGTGTNEKEVHSKLNPNQFSGDTDINIIFENCWKYSANMYVNSYLEYEATLMLPSHIINNFDYTAGYKIDNSIFLVEDLAYNLEKETITYRKSKLRAI